MRFGWMHRARIARIIRDAPANFERSGAETESPEPHVL
jgi:hypothetical protein